MKRIKKLGTTMIATIIAMGIFSLPVSAHVTGKPETSDVNSWETYTIKVPVEKNISNKQSHIKKLPSGRLSFTSIEPLPGWKVEAQKDSCWKR
ncbi:Hypothetical membrane associated protein [Bacillus thuringiensis serovar israelensis ATCC 35646]|nr:Hypothetical membrane associated protein [Bacillus thuringiensis serovar israelensis ATCC 35646]